MTKTRGSSGLTLIEVVIAILILAVGVLALAALQTSSLAATGTARDLQELNADARSEMDVWRARLSDPGALYPTIVDGACATRAECQVQISPCVLVNGPQGSAASLDCTLSTVPDPAAHAVKVVVRNARDESRAVTLNSIVMRSTHVSGE